jgi:hypothetical protein
VIPARGDLDDVARQAWNVDRGEAVDGWAISELTAGVMAPALEAAPARERAGVIAARGDCDDVAREAHNVNRDEAVGRRAVAELAELIVAPAFDSAGVRERAGVTVARGKLL